MMFDATCTSGRRRLTTALTTLIVAVGLSLAVVWPAGPASAEPIGNSSTAGDRYGDLLRAARCMDFTNFATKDYLEEPGQAEGGHAKWKTADGAAHGFDRRLLTLGDSPSYRPKAWSADDLLADRGTFRGTYYKRYQTPAGAPPGTYNLSFTVMSNDDTVFVCIQGTEPEVFPTGKPRGNTLNNLAAAPMVMPMFDDRALVHEGWALVSAYYHQTVLDPILQRHGLKSGKKQLIITGHSQGGVLAGYIAFLLVKHGDLASERRHRLVTLDAPRYGTPSMQARFREVLSANAPSMTVDAIEIEGDLVPMSWPFGAVPVGTLWLGRAADIGYKMPDDGLWSAHYVGIPSWLALKIIATKGAYTGPSLAGDVRATAELALATSCPAGFSKGAVACIADTCPSGAVKRGGRCASACPAGSKPSGTGNHCITTHKARPEQKVWVGNLKPKADYAKACPKGTIYARDAFGYSYCTKSCPASHPKLVGDQCHTSCGALPTDAFGNCEVYQDLATRPFQCPAGAVLRGVACFKP